MNNNPAQYSPALNRRAHNRPAQDRIARGILFMCAAAALFSMMNGLVKVLSAELPSLQIVWARTLGHLIFVSALFVPKEGWSVLRSQRLGTQLTRSALLMSSTLLYFFALRYTSLAEATSISFLAPSIVTLLAVPMLGEKILPSRFAVVIIGFIGVIIVMQPGTAVFHWSSLLILGSAALYAVYQVLTRRVSSADRAETSAIYSALLGAILTSALVPFIWSEPANWQQWVMLGTLGLLGGLGHYCVACAMFNAPANIVSPFQYLQLFGAVLFGYWVFDNIPSALTWLGAAVVVASGLYLGWSETQRKA